MNKPTVVVIENAIDATGSLFSVIRSSIFLRDQFTFEFVLPSEGRAADTLRSYGFRVWVIPMKELRRNASSMLFYIPVLLVNGLRFRSLARKRNATVVVSNDFYNLTPVVSALFGLKTPYVCYVRFMPSKFPRVLSSTWFNLNSKFAQKIIGVSEAVKRELPPSSKTMVIYNELPEYTVEFQISSFKLILFPANYINGKGQDHALEAFAKIADRYPDWKLRFVGGDMGLQKNRTYKSSLVGRAEELGLKYQVEFLEFSTNLMEHYREAAFVLNFSESESFSLTTLEAQYNGRAVVVTRCGGPEEIVIDGETGILVPVKDIDVMARAIEQLIVQSEVRQQMGLKAYAHVREKFSHQNTSGKLAEVYRSAMRR